MATIFHEFRADQTAFINPGDVIKPLEDFPKVCITTFFGEYHKQCHKKA